MDYTPKILADEKKYTDFVDRCATQVAGDSKIKLILVAGPSCAGKTTTTKLLAEHLNAMNRKAYTVSIDDFYKNGKEIPRNADGTPDYESPDGFDLDSLHNCLQKLSSGESADIPHFDFTMTSVVGIRETVTLDEQSVAILEGLHALNPLVYKDFVPEERMFKIFLDCHTASPSTMRYSRLMRRLVRDYKYRNSDAENTFYLWKNVLDGEQKYIYPFVKFADTEINTRFDYEPHIFKNRVLEVLDGMPENSVYTNLAKEIRSYLDGIYPISPEFVPTDSLLQEFL